MKFLINGYTQDESIFTVYLQAKQKYLFSRVPVINPTKGCIGSYMDLANLCTIQQVIKCGIKLLYTLYIHLDTTPVVLFADFNPAR